MKTISVFFTLGLLGAPLLSANSTTAAPLPLSAQQDFPPLKLRGYGTLSGTMHSTADQSASILQITCENEDKAKLVLAKYLSDLQVLRGLKISAATTASGLMAAYEVEGQGFVRAARDGVTVEILTAATPELLGQLSAQVFTAQHPLVFTAEVPVPMALDRFDKFGLQSYYHPYQSAKARTPTNTTVPDQIKDFEFAQEENHMGLVLAQGPANQVSADGISTANALDWVQATAQEKQIPLGINLDVYNTFALKNRYPEQVIQYQPQFFGGWYGSMNFGDEILSWNAFEAKDIALGEVQNSIREMAKNPNITDWLEGHSEMGHGIADFMLEYGPTADAGYRRYLQTTYRTVDVVSQRWYGDATKLKSWDDVRVPELYSFVGWGPDAIDLTGTWHINYDAPFDSTSAAPGLDDSSWPTIQAPGHGIVRVLPHTPAVFRRHLAIDSAWRKAHDRIWIYVWDFNDNRVKPADPRSTVQVFINGKLIPEIPRHITESHWTALDVSRQLTDGDNLIAVDLPKGMFNGRAYLSPHEPFGYPDLGSQLNAQWADFADWNRWTREQAVMRGTQMIRQVSPISGIKLAAPAEYVDGIKNAAIAYGGDLHDTGAMAGFWNERLSALMRGANLPISAEPGGPASTPLILQAFFGRWITEGVNQIDYFQELGDLNWYPDIKECLDANRNIFTSIGKYHAPVAEVATFYSSRNAYMKYFPWNTWEDTTKTPSDLGSGYWIWNSRAFLRNFYESDGLSESSFDHGDADRYKVILDSNSSIMDDKLLSGIEQYVRNGGVFVTFVQTGRNTSAEKDAWPIEKLTGYHVTSVSQKNPWQNNALKWAPNQPIFSGDWIKARADGLSMKKVADDAQDLAYWKDDGSVAIGMRPLGKGFIIELGCRFTKGGVPQRFDYDIWNWYKINHCLDQYGLPPTLDNGLWSPELRAQQQLFLQVVKWQKIDPMPMKFEPDNEHVMLRHDISNNGLYDVWELWNDSPTETVTGHLNLEKSLNPDWQIELKTGRQSPFAHHRIDVLLAPCQTSIYLTPRNALASAPAEWFNLQRHWWQGTQDPGKPFPRSSPNLAIDLTQDWAFKPLDTATDASPMADPQFNDSDWKRMKLGIFSLPDFPDTKHAIFRKQFTVPADWDKGRVQMTIQSWNGSTILDQGKIYLDGKPIPKATDGLIDDDFGGALKAGSTHVIAIEVTGGKSELVGVRGPAWIAYHPDPADRLDLSGAWDITTDNLHYTAGQFPGLTKGTAARRIIKIDAAQSSRTVVVHALGESRFLSGVIINGRYISLPWYSPEENLNITPFVKFGQDNELILLSRYKNGNVKEVSLEFHEKGTYP
jgi:hypothetical protein